jgi:Arc/MetJ-type ribon-helix-helix transcriptional regulator
VVLELTFVSVTAANTDTNVNSTTLAHKSRDLLGHGCLAMPPFLYYITTMKTLTVRLPEALIADIEAESRNRRMSKSDVVRERLERAPGPRHNASYEAIADLIGSVDDDLPADLSARKKAYLRATGYGRNRSR